MGGEKQKAAFLKLGLHSKATNPRLEGGKRSCRMAQGHSGIRLQPWSVLAEVSTGYQTNKPLESSGS